jgi:hypothetical protein
MMLILIFTIVQVGLWSFARSLALGAAQEGVAMGGAYGNTPADGIGRAKRFLGKGGRDSLIEPEVLAVAGADFLTVTVSGRSLSVLPGIAGWRVEQSAAGPLERFTIP